MLHEHTHVRERHQGSDSVNLMPRNPVNPFVPDFMLDLATAWVWLVSALPWLLSLLPKAQSRAGAAAPPSPYVFVPPRSVFLLLLRPMPRTRVCFAARRSCAVNTPEICQDRTSDAALRAVYRVGLNNFTEPTRKSNKSIQSMSLLNDMREV